MITSDLLHNVDSEIQRDLLELDTRPPYIRSAELKYKLSDLEAALNKKPITIRVSGYIQMDVNRAVERDALLRWFQATWSPVGGQLAHRSRTEEVRGAPVQTPGIRGVGGPPERVPGGVTGSTLNSGYF
jgi:hypothetical protein